MSVQKFRAIEEMPAPAPLRPLDPQNLRLACELMSLGHGFSPIKYVPGVHKYTSFDALLIAREQWEALATRATRHHS